jgi:hypothetical protein
LYLSAPNLYLLAEFLVRFEGGLYLTIWLPLSDSFVSIIIVFSEEPYGEPRTFLPEKLIAFKGIGPSFLDCDIYVCLTAFKTLLLSFGDVKLNVDGSSCYALKKVFEGEPNDEPKFIGDFIFSMLIVLLY